VLAVSGTAEEVERALDLGVGVLTVEGLTSTEPSRPGSLPGEDNFYGPDDLRAAYAACTTEDGAGQTIAVVSGAWTDPLTQAQVAAHFFPDDVANYVAMIHGHAGATPTPAAISADGAPTTPDPDEATLETSLDMEMTLAMAPGALVETFEGYNDLAIMNAIATHQPLAQQITNSYFICVQQEGAAYQQVLYTYAAQGQSFYHASGDDGGFVWDGNCSDGLGKDLRALDAITQVGGTVLDVEAHVWAAESAWTDEGLKSGGGVYIGTPTPAYQLGIATTQNGGSSLYRSVPDVAAVAHQVDIWFHNGPNSTGANPSMFNATGGTSAAAPLWAGFTAVINASLANPSRTLGFANPSLYAIGLSPQAPSFFHDIDDGGQNCDPDPPPPFACFSAVDGYDLVTGLGSPQCALISELSCATTCGGSLCVDLNSDPANCAACGHSCGSGSCAGGTCVPGTPVVLAQTQGPQGITQDAGHVYWTDGVTAYSVLKGQPGTTVALVPIAHHNVGDREPPWSIAVDGANAYWGTDEVDTLLAAPLAGAPAAT
jgi:subtilase family serine protease